MWKLESIKATNICAFEQLDYTFDQNRTTLVFGNNMDDDSQNSNGSGKSALIEAIAISITGETLRKVNMDEIINDAHDSATLEAVLSNPSEDIVLTVTRTLTRKKPQSVSIIANRSTGKNSGEVEEIKQPSVADYNKFILDTIGLSKDDVFSNFILTAKKYKSFLSSSDREKKEIINRFSNGVLVDESIQALSEDIAPVEEQLIEAEKSVSECNGRVSALNEEIERVLQESEDRQLKKKARIDGWRQSIIDKRAEIRETKEKIREFEGLANKIDRIDERIQELSNGSQDFLTTYDTIVEELYCIDGHDEIADYSRKYKELHEEQKSLKSKLNVAEKEREMISKSFETANERYQKISGTYEADLSDIDTHLESADEEIKNLGNKIKEIRNSETELNRKRASIYASIGSLEKQLAGTIICPKCKHEFALSGDFDVPEAKKALEENKRKADDIERRIEDNQKSYNKCVDAGKSARQVQNTWTERKDELKNIYRNASEELDNIKTSSKRMENTLSSIQSEIDRVANKLNNLRDTMFDEVFAYIDSRINTCESGLKNLKLSISNMEGAIKSYEESIEEAENSAETDVTESLRASLEKYKKELQKSTGNRDDIERQLNELKKQEATFIEFKTHLANTKIDAISQITNDFLETIGSDIRVVFSGFTILKSGKVRDKISVSLIRDGVDCGSFDKFSRGEQTRVELACILAMHELLNMNCLDGKGLNLLVIDEILDAADEQGLSNVFKALNETQITSLVVSHGNIAENYPNRLIVCKKNGVSFI